MTRPPLAERTRGRWKGILPQLGVDAKYLTNKHGACPICRVGRDRFRFDDKRSDGTYICSKCGAGDGVKLVMEVNGWDFRTAAKRIEEVMGDVPADPPKQDRPEPEKREALNRLWRDARPVTAADAAGRFLARRVGIDTFPPDLRFSGRVRYEDDPPSWHPAMIALVREADGKPVSIHRTYLTVDGQKAPVKEPRRFMPGKLPSGSAVRLFPPGPVMGIAEGIETAFAASRIFGVPTWAALNSTLLAQWIPPAEAKRVMVFGDRDQKFGGQAAAYALAQRLCTGREPINASVELPERDGTDWNDVLKEHQ